MVRVCCNVTMDEWRGPDEQNALPDAGEVVAAATRFLGPACIKHLSICLEDPESAVLAANPATFMNAVKELINVALDRRQAPSHDDFRNGGLALLRFTHSIGDAALSDQESLGSSVGRAVLDVFRRAKAAAGLERIAEVLMQNDAGSRHIGWNTLCAGFDLTRVVQGPKQALFEERVGSCMTAVRSAAEAWYRPLLVRLLDLELLAGAKDAVKGSPSLGQLEERLQSVGLGDLIEPDLLTIRNASSHAGMVFNVDREEVSFTNVTPKGAERTLGPWGPTRIEEFADGFLSRCLIISFAIVKSISDEIWDAVDGKFPGLLRTLG